VNLAAIIGVILFFLILAVVFRRTLGTVEKPRPVLEAPPMPKDLSAAVLRIEKWKSEGRISREDYERLMEMCREDAQAEKRV
jgi:hypothetical protein